MKKIGLLQTLVMALATPLLLAFTTQQQTCSFLIGSGLILMSFALMGLGYGLIFKKKLVALSIGIIVFKYAILGIIIFQLVKQPWLSSLWFCLGIASFGVSALLYALSEVLAEGKENVV
jgi:hypothetical protein